jgi:hypothetical protein
LPTALESQYAIRLIEFQMIIRSCALRCKDAVGAYGCRMSAERDNQYGAICEYAEHYFSNIKHD